MQRHAAADKPRFVISVGDNFYPKGVSGIDDPAWNESFEHVYTSPELQCPWYVVLGNHDHHGSIAAQIEYSSRSKRWVMLAEYYKRTESVAPGSDIDLFFLDTEPIASPPSIFTRLWKGEADPEEQVEWLDRELSTSKARWKIVVGHHPIVSVGRHGPSAPSAVPLAKTMASPRRPMTSGRMPTGSRAPIIMSLVRQASA